LIKNDTNNFNRFEAFQNYIKEIIIDNYNCKNTLRYLVSEDFLEMFKYILEEKSLSNSFKAETLVLPSV
jgi:hypothetical protein